MSHSSSKWKKRRAIPYTPRDVQLLYALCGIKYMTTTQIYELFWRAASRNPLLALKSCQRRLRQLEQYGVIRRIHQAVKRGEGSKPDLFKLAENSLPLLEYECGVDPKAVDVAAWADEEINPKIKHILAATDVHIAVLKACTACGYTLEEWIDESALRSAPVKDTITLIGPSGKETSISLIPDVFFIVSVNGKRGFYRLEVDRATIELEASREQKRSIAQKLRRYLHLEQSQFYREHYGTRPLLVLWAVKGERRRRNMCALAAKVIRQIVQLPDKVPLDEQQKQAYEKKQAEFNRLSTRFLFTTLEQITQHNLLTEPIWYCAGRDTPRMLHE